MLTYSWTAFYAVNPRLCLYSIGYPYVLKLSSCMTTFEIAAPDVPEIGMVPDKFYGDVREIDD